MSGRADYDDDKCACVRACVLVPACACTSIQDTDTPQTSERFYGDFTVFGKRIRVIRGRDGGDGRQLAAGAGESGVIMIVRDYSRGLRDIVVARITWLY